MAASERHGLFMIVQSLYGSGPDEHPIAGRACAMTRGFLTVEGAGNATA